MQQISQLALKEKLNEKIQLLEETSRRLKEAGSGKTLLKEKQNKLLRVVAKLEDNLVKKEKLVEKEEDQLQSNEHLKIQISQLEKQVKQTEAELTVRTRELTEVSKDLHNRKQVLRKIAQLASSHD